MNSVMKYLAILGLLFQCVHAAKILGVFTIASYSHFTLGNRYMRELALRGHEVTYVSAYKDKNPPKGYRDVTLEGIADKMEEMKKELNMFELQNIPIFLAPLIFSQIMIEITENVLSHPNFQELLQSNATFDLIILEFRNEALRGLQHHYKAPVIISSSVGPSSFINSLVMNPFPSSYIPNMHLLHTKREMHFLTRVKNFLYNMLEEAILLGYMYPNQNKLLQTYFKDAPHLYDLLYDNPLILLNSHISTSRPVPRTQNMIDVGGYHVFPAKKLPENLQKFLDEAEEGAILFSMGSTLKSTEIAQEKREAILKVFSKLKMKILWKWEEDSLPGQPNNVMLQKWLPQQDILPHPNIKLFITQGGLLSTTEAIYHGVPVVGIPIFGDQQTNMVLAEIGGYGRTVLYGEINEETLGAAINEVLNNKKYRENAKRRQKLLHDRPMTPIDTAMWWIEYVLRNPESDFHRSPGIDLRWYQVYLLDVLVFLGIAISCSIYGFPYILKKLCCRKNKNSTNSSEKKKN